MQVVQEAGVTRRESGEQRAVGGVDAREADAVVQLAPVVQARRVRGEGVRDVAGREVIPARMPGRSRAQASLKFTRRRMTAGEQRGRRACDAPPAEVANKA